MRSYFGDTTLASGCVAEDGEGTDHGQSLTHRGVPGGCNDFFMPLSPGHKLGPYEIVTPLGEGRMGEVWRARDTRLDREVA